MDGETERQLCTPQHRAGLVGDCLPTCAAECPLRLLNSLQPLE